MEDADEPIGQPPQNRTVIKTAVAQFVVVSAGTGEVCNAENACEFGAPTSRSPKLNRSTTTFILPEVRVIGLVPA